MTPNIYRTPPAPLDNPWRDAAETFCAAGVAFDAGWHECMDQPRYAPPRVGTVSNAFRAGFYAAKASDALQFFSRPTRLEMSLAALKRVERRGVDSFGAECCPCCFGKPAAPRRRHIGAGGSVLVARSILHAADCQLAQALYGEWT